MSMQLSAPPLNQPKDKRRPPTVPRLRPWSRDEYYAMSKLGFFDQQRVELLWGAIVEMTPVHTPHAAGLLLGLDALQEVFGDGYVVRPQLPLDLSAASSPEPDLAVVSGAVRDYLGEKHPTTALLVVEVSDSTLATDRSVKAPLYASANLQEYWIINLVDGQLEIYRDPQVNAADPKQSRYGQLMTLKRGDSVSPLAAPNATIQVSDLLP